MLLLMKKAQNLNSRKILNKKTISALECSFSTNEDGQTSLNKNFIKFKKNKDN